MPKLLNINNYHYRRGGSDVVYLEHAAMMEQQGWETAFFSMHHPKNFESAWSRYFVDEIEFGHTYSLASKILMATKVVYSFEAKKKAESVTGKFSGRHSASALYLPSPVPLYSSCAGHRWCSDSDDSS